jgi:hypothetical protein
MPKSSPPLAFVWSTPPVRVPELRPPLRERIADLTRRLRSAHDEYEQAAQSWKQGAADRKRDARKAREDTLREIEDLLAQEGEGEWLAGLKKRPFAQKFIELEALIGGEPAVQEAAVAAPEQAPVQELHGPTAVEGSDSTPSTAEGGGSEPVVATVVASGIVAVSTVAGTAETESAGAAASPAHSPSPKSDRVPAAAAEVALSNLPVLPMVTYGRRRWGVASMTTSPFGMGVVLIVLALAVIGGWQAARRRGAPSVEQTSPLADPARR